MSRPLPTAAAHALLHLTVFVWGFTAILGRSISIGAVPLVFYRLVIVVVAMGAIARLRRVPWNLAPATVRALLVAGAMVGVHWILFYGCIKSAGVAVAVLCLSSGTFFTACFEPVAFRRAVHLGELLIGLFVVAGVSLLVRLETRATVVGLGMGLGSSLFAAAFGTLNGRVARSVPAEVITLVELSTALCVTCLFFLARPADFVAPAALSVRDLALLLLLAIGCTVVPWLWNLRVLETLSPYTVSLAVSLEPVYSITLAYFIFPDAEQLGVRFYLGAAVLVLLVLANGWMKRPRSGPWSASQIRGPPDEPERRRPSV
jgi:drug/metabolite transporter (DMT)-like permease